MYICILKIELSFFFISLFRFVFYFFPSIFFISVYFVGFVSFCFHFVDFVSFLFRFALYRYPIHLHLMTFCLGSCQEPYFKLTNQQQAFQILRYIKKAHTESGCLIGQYTFTFIFWLDIQRQIKGYLTWPNMRCR